MTKRELLLLAALWLGVGEPAAGPLLVAPRDGGLVLGRVVPVQVARCAQPPQAYLDGRPVELEWTALPRRHHWSAELPLSPGPHTLELRRHGRPARARFTAGMTDARALGDRVAAETLAGRDLPAASWIWGPAILLYGLHRQSLGSEQGDASAAALHAYHARYTPAALPAIDYPDRYAPALTAVGLARDRGDPVGLPAAQVVAEAIRREPRNALGAIDHLGADSTVRTLAGATGVVRALGLDPFVAHWTHSIWVDSLVMYALVAVQYGVYTDDPELVTFGLSQPAIFAEVLQDPATGLFGHAWDTEHAHRQGATWLRGNGWVAFSLVEMLADAPADHPRRPELVRILRALTDGLLARQDAAGLWPTLLEQPGSEQETSGSALVAYALAKGARQGHLPADRRAAARRTFQALTARLAPRGAGHVVTGTSIATSAWPTRYYTWVPRRDDVDWGVGAYLLLADELRAERW